MTETTEISRIDNSEATTEQMRRDELVGWVMSHVDPWRRWRDSQFGSRWAEYYRLWRGFWVENDKSRESERSKLISPALQQAVEMTVAEMEEATFGRGTWIDIADDYEDPQKDDVLALRDQLISDLEYCSVPSAVSETYLNGALYGTGIGKVMIGRYTTGPYAGQFKVWLEPIAPQNFIMDPAARSVDDGLGCAHEIAVPRHRVVKRQLDKVYYNTPAGPWQGETEMFDMAGRQLTRDIDKTNVVYITEYHGLVPKRLTQGNYTYEAAPQKDGADGRSITDDGEMVEAIVTIANKSILLRDVENPYENKDRAIVAYQHETVPNQFWGRGVSEKGFNPQKALDAELRARMDALGLLTYPVMGADATRLPRGLDLKLRPGRLFLLNGRPSEILEPITFGNLDPNTFQNTADLERMVQMGTGAMDSATPLDSNRRNETSSGMSMQFGGFIKRSKRTMQNVERQFLSKFIQKALWRYMQFDPERYPTDFKFIVKSSMGIMAREVEQAILAQLIQVVPPESQLFPMVIKGIIENGASPNKGEMMKTIEAMMQPDPQAQQNQQKMQQLQIDAAEWTVKKLQAETTKLFADAEKSRAQGEKEGMPEQGDGTDHSLDDDYAEIEAARVVLENKKIELEKELAKIEAAMKVQEMQLRREEMDHEKIMAEQQLKQDQQMHEQKMSQNDESHKQKITQSKEMGKVKTQQAKSKPKADKKK
jgi:hypothetical protein